MNGFRTALSKYAQFSGRSRRAEYWGFALVNAVIVVVAEVLIFAIGRNSDNSFTALGWILIAAISLYGLAVLIPGLALQWRRYQDIGWAGAVSIIGWFVPLLTLIVAFIPGNVGDNAYGSDPKAS